MTLTMKLEPSVRSAFASNSGGLRETPTATTPKACSVGKLLPKRVGAGVLYARKTGYHHVSYPTRKIRADWRETPYQDCTYWYAAPSPSTDGHLSLSLLIAIALSSFHPIGLPGRDARRYARLIRFPIGQDGAALMNELNPPPENREKAHFYDVSMQAIVTCVIAEIIAVPIAAFILKTHANPILLAGGFSTTILIIIWYFCYKKYKEWLTPYQIFVTKLDFEPCLKNGKKISIEIEFQIPNMRAKQGNLEILYHATLAGLNRTLSQLALPPDYPEMKLIVQQAIEPDMKIINMFICRVKIVSINPPPAFLNKTDLHEIDLGESLYDGNLDS
jgi:hypothetical protein